MRAIESGASLAAVTDRTLTLVRAAVGSVAADLTSEAPNALRYTRHEQALGRGAPVALPLTGRKVEAVGVGL